MSSVWEMFNEKCHRDVQAQLVSGLLRRGYVVIQSMAVTTGEEKCAGRGGGGC